MELSFSEFVDGTEVRFAIDIFRADTDGTLWVYVEAHADLSIPFRLRPSFVFRKLRDGTAYWIR